MRGKDWANVETPTLTDFDELAAVAWARMPRAFRDLCGDVTIQIEDFATDDVLRELGLDSAFDLLGLYQGVSLDKKSVMDPGGMPDRVYLYRRPILDYWAEHEEALGHIVSHVLIHEIGHHFGLSDADMEKIETDARD
jgi:predicted Zn-dependent protease with MMP-like domain